MNSKILWLAGAALVSAPFLSQIAVAAESKPFVFHRLYTGPDMQTHVEEIQVKASEAYKLLGGPGAEIRTAPPGRVADWHTAPRRQYVITLSGRGEVELNDGTKIALGPGSIDLAEDLTGKGHITRVVGNEPRVTLAIPVVEK